MVDIMKNNIILTVCVAVAMTFSLPSQAQRLIPKQRGIEVVGSVPLFKGEKFLAADNFGMGAALTRYLGREDYTFVMAEYEQQNMPYRSYNVKLKDLSTYLKIEQILLVKMIQIFEELGFVTIENGVMKVNKDADKRDIAESQIYQNLKPRVSLATVFFIINFSLYCVYHFLFVVYKEKSTVYKP